MPEDFFGAVFNPDGKVFLTGSDDGAARHWDASTGHMLGQPVPHRGPLKAVAFNPKGETILTGGLDATARITKVPRDLSPRLSLTHLGSVWWASFSPDGRTVLTGSQDGTARLWDVASGRPRRRGHIRGELSPRG